MSRSRRWHFERVVAIALIALHGSIGVQAQERPKPDGTPISWPSFSSALQAASASRRIVLIDVFSPTCPWCRKSQRDVYTDPGLQKYLYDTFELGRIDISIDTDSISFRNYTLSSAELGAGFGATGTPTTIFLEPNGDYITRLPGYHDLEEFSDVLRWIGSRSYREMSFPDYLQAKN